MTDLPRALSVPTAVDAILEAFRAIPDSDLEIQDGPQEKASKRKVIAVGIGRPAIEVSVVYEPRVAGGSYPISFDVSCSLFSWGGRSVDAKTHRDNCAGLLSEVTTRVDSLNDALFSQGFHFEMVGGEQYLQSYGGGERACIVGFAIHVDCRTVADS